MMNLSLLMRRRNPGGGGAADPLLSLFAPGDVGGVYRVWDAAALTTDTAGTTQAVVGNSVARITDPATGLHLLQSTAAARPDLAELSGYRYLDFDGVDDWMVTGAANFNTYTHVGVWSYDAGVSTFDSAFTVGSAGFSRLYEALGKWFHRTSAGSGAAISTTTIAGLGKHVLTIIRNGNTSLTCRINGVEELTITPNSTETFNAFAVGSGETDVWTNGLLGKFFGGVQIAKVLTSDQIAAAEAEVAARTGVTL